MISFRIDSHRFHYRAAAVVRSNEHVLLHRLEGDEFWALPGGRVDAGERAQDAIRREFLEELGVSVECEDLVCVGENFFEYNGEPHHEIGLYFAARISEGSEISDQGRIHFGVEGGRRLEFKWFPLAELPNMDMRPAVLRAALSAGSVPIHFVQQDDAA